MLGFFLHALAVSAMVLLAQYAQSQTCVYSNALGYGGNFYFSNANPALPASAGNEVVLAGGATASYDNRRLAGWNALRAHRWVGV